MYESHSNGIYLICSYINFDYVGITILGQMFYLYDNTSDDFGRIASGFVVSI